MTCDADILAFARREAGDMPVTLEVQASSGDGYDIQPMGDGHHIIGTNARGCLHGVYHLRMGRPAGRHHAAFSIRGVNTCESLSSHTPDKLRLLIDRMGKWRMNRLIVHTCYGWRHHRDLIIEECGKRGIELVFYVYTSIVFLPKDAPSRWLAKNAEGQPFTHKPECETRPCLNEPEGLKAFEAGAERFFAQDCGPAHHVLAMTGDGYSHCRCPACASLSAVEQWQPLLRRFIDAGRAKAPEKKLETISYVHRYRPPADMSIHRRLDHLMFDLFPRMIWRPIGAEHPTLPDHGEVQADPQSAGVHINVYLMERLKEWREKFPGKLYVFDDLNRHGTFSCPQPCTGVMLEDLKQFQRIGVDGMVYEVLVGCDSFIEQLGILADALWSPHDVSYTPTPVERWLTDHAPPAVLFFRKPLGFPWDRFADQWEDVVRRHMENIRDAYDEPTHANVRRLLEHMNAHPDRFHRLNIAFNFLKMAHKLVPIADLTETERRFLTITKMWDYMEPYDDPRQAVDAVTQSLLRKL
ncbi:MAG: hypothetical protein IT440_07885 [Phycisphaeraceae bacterium]|nr:hypothetical protein [Phycisphaeraceae bacterium]